MIAGYFTMSRFTRPRDIMFRDPIRSTPIVQDVSDINLRLAVTRADSALLRTGDIRLPQLRVW